MTVSQTLAMAGTVFVVVLGAFVAAAHVLVLVVRLIDQRRRKP